MLKHLLFILDCLSAKMIPASPHGVTVMQRSLQSVLFAPKDLADKRLQICSSPWLRGTQIEKTYLLSTRPSLRTELWSASVSLGEVVKFFLIKLFFLSLVSIICQEDKLTRGFFIPLHSKATIEPEEQINSCPSSDERRLSAVITRRFLCLIYI